MKEAIWSVASSASRSMAPSIVRSAPTLKYFSYSEARTIARTSGSPPSASKASASSCMRSSAIALFPLRCMTTRAIEPSRLTSTHSPIGLSSEEWNAACDLDHSARDVSRLLGAQEGDRVCDVHGLAEALEHGALLEALVHGVVLRRCLAGLALDDAGCYRVGCDVVAPSLERRRSREPDEAGFGRRVAGLPESSERAGHRRHEDQPAPLVLHHVRPRFLRAVEGSGEVHAYVAIPELVGLVWDLCRVVQRRRVVDQDVEAPELLPDLLEDFTNLLAIGDVHLDG